jgi:hypothetical protein
MNISIDSKELVWLVGGKKGKVQNRKFMMKSSEKVIVKFEVASLAKQHLLNI